MANFFCELCASFDAVDPYFIEHSYNWRIHVEDGVASNVQSN